MDRLVTRHRYTITAAAETLSVSTKTIRAMIAEGKLKKVEDVTGEGAARPFVTGKSIDDYMESLERKPLEALGRAEARIKRQKAG